jgi:hypothetical protein
MGTVETTLARPWPGRPVGIDGHRLAARQLAQISPADLAEATARAVLDLLGRPRAA